MLTASLAEDREEGRPLGLVDQVAHSDRVEGLGPAACFDLAEHSDLEEELPDTQVQRCLL